MRPSKRNAGMKAALARIGATKAQQDRSVPPARTAAAGKLRNKSATKPRRRNPESAIVKACLEWLHAHGIWAWRQNAAVVPGRRFNGMPGQADIIGLVSRACAGGRFLAVECKTETGRLTEDQVVFLNRVKAHDGLAVVVRSVADLEAFGRKQGWCE